MYTSQTDISILFYNPVFMAQREQVYNGQKSFKKKQKNQINT